MANQNHHGKRLSALLGGVLMLGAPSVHAADWGVGARVGTLGLGVDVSRSIIPTVNARVGINAFDYSFDFDTDDFEYDGDLKLRSLHVLADWHPVATRFRVTGGLLYNRNKFQVTSEDNDGELEAEVDFDRIAPYVGIGWGNATSGLSPVSWSVDLGIVAQGSPNVSLSERDTGLSRAELQDEEDEIEDDLSGFDTYPVVSVGLIVRF